MKKLYTTLLSLCAAFAASATAPTPVDFTVTSATNEAKVEFVKTSHKEAATVAATAKRHKAPAKAHENDKWETVGESKFLEGIISPIYGLNTPPEFKVIVEKSTTTDGLYRIQEPYKDFAALSPSLFSYSAAKATPMYIQVVDGNKCYVEEFNTGLTDLTPDDGGDIAVKDQASSLIEANGLAAVLKQLPEVLSKFQANAFVFDNATFQLSGKTYYTFLVSVGDPSAGYYAGNKNGATKIMLPGSSFKDMTIAVSNASCFDDNKIKFTVKPGSDVESYALGIYKGDIQANASNFAIVAKNGQKLTKTQTSLTTDLSTSDDGIYTILAVSLNADGTAAEGARGLVFVTGNDKDYDPVEGKAKYTDDIMNSLYQQFTTPEYEVAIEKSTTKDGLYRLVNPYAAPYANASKNKHVGTHNHYLVLDCSDPDKVELVESAIGYELGDGAVTVTSNETGTLKDGVITFPTKGLIARELNYNDAAWYYANSNGTFKVVLPASMGVADSFAEADADAPAEYFSLQGVRVDNPAPGQLVIRRQGSKVQKMIVR